MCFRPNALTQNDSNTQIGNCPTCGMPVAAEEGVTSGTCPYCLETIPAPINLEDIDPSYSKRIL